MEVDPTTFVTKDAVLSFYVDLQGEEKRRVKGLILQGGGELSKDYDDAVLVITDKGVAESDSKIFLPASYVDDSVSYGQQVFQDYALSTASSSSSSSTSSTTPTTTPSTAVKFSGRSHYSQADDNKMLAFVNSHPHFSVSGNSLWQEAADAKVTKHSWMSMRDHYLKVLLPKTVNGNKTLQKKTKSFTDDDYSKLYSAFSADKSKATTAKSATTTAKTATTTATATTAKPTTPSDSKEAGDKDKEEEDEEESLEASDENGSASVDFNAPSTSSEPMEELLEHLLTSEESSKKAKKKTKKSKSDNIDNTTTTTKSKTNTATPSSSSSSSTKTPQPKVTNQKMNGTNTKQTPSHTTPIASVSTPKQTPSPSSSSFSATPSSARKPLYSAGKKRAATEQNMRGNAKRVRAHMEQVAQKLGLPQAVVYHAYILHSGDPVKARKYLTSSLKNEESDPWMPHEDKILSGSHNSEQLEQLIKRHGKDKCIARTNFLDNSDNSGT